MNGTLAKPIVTLDIIVPRYTPDSLSILLIRRKKPPYQNMWAVPGGKLDESDATLEDAAVRELFEETGLLFHPSTLLQVGTFGDADRDPRGRYVSVAYTIQPLSTFTTLPVQAGDDAADAQWWPVVDLPPLAFDHQRILAAALRTLKEVAA